MFLFRTSSLSLRDTSLSLLGRVAFIIRLVWGDSMSMAMEGKWKGREWNHTRLASSKIKDTKPCLIPHAGYSLLSLDVSAIKSRHT